MPKFLSFILSRIIFTLLAFIIAVTVIDTLLALALYLEPSDDAPVGANVALSVVRGEFGVSLRFQQPVTDLIAERLPTTLELLLLALLTSGVIGIVGGLLLARLRTWATDFFLRPLFLLGGSLPIFWLGLLLIYNLGVVNRALPIAGRCGPSLTADGCPPLFERLDYLILPLLTLTIFWGSALALHVREGVLAAVRRDESAGLRGKHLAEAVFAITPLGLTTMTGALLGSLVVVEALFAFPGVGRLLVEAAASRDFPLLAGITYVLAVIGIAAYFLFNLVYGVAAQIVGSQPQGYTVALQPRVDAIAEQQRTPQPPPLPGRVFDLLTTFGAVVGLVVVVVMVILSYTPSLVTSVEPNFTDLVARLAEPGTEGHPLGTDELGRDTLARLLAAGTTGFSIALGAAFVALLMGLVAGAIGGIADGIVGSILNVPANALAAVLTMLPLLPLLVYIVGVAQPEPGILAWLLGLTGWMNVLPLVRAHVRLVRRRVPEGSRHIRANRLLLFFGIIGYSLAINTAAFLLAEASLSFLGLGVLPPTPTWGNMLSNAAQYVQTAPWLLIYPGLALTVVVVSLSLIAVKLRDSFNFLVEA